MLVAVSIVGLFRYTADKDKLQLCHEAERQRDHRSFDHEATPRTTADIAGIGNDDEGTRPCNEGQSCGHRLLVLQSLPTATACWQLAEVEIPAMRLNPLQVVTRRPTHGKGRSCRRWNHRLESECWHPTHDSRQGNSTRISRHLHPICLGRFCCARPKEHGIATNTLQSPPILCWIWFLLQTLEQLHAISRAVQRS